MADKMKSACKRNVLEGNPILQFIEKLGGVGQLNHRARVKKLSTNVKNELQILGGIFRKHSYLFGGVANAI